jgi:predicted O-methyltransferase YrrM
MNDAGVAKARRQADKHSNHFRELTLPFVSRILRAPVRAVRTSYHSLCAGFLPVSFTSEEFLARRRRMGWRPLTPDEAKRNARERVSEFSSVVEHSARELAEFIEEAATVEWDSGPRHEERPLPSPMSRKDLYLLYAAVRSLRPERAVETGVANGCSSAMILAAMERNGKGRLLGIDSLVAERDRLGRRIPLSLRGRFTLRLGDSIATLTDMVDRGEPIDFFLHDSLHTYRHARREYELAWRMLTPGGLLCSHDILYNNAFDRFVTAHGTEWSGFAKVGNFGVARKRTGEGQAAGR